MFAIFFETTETAQGHPQYLVFPTNAGQSVIFHRISDGNKGGLNRWGITDSIPAGLSLTREPTTVLVSESDTIQYASTGMPSTLSSKALKAHQKAPETEITTDGLQSLADEVAARDEALNRWLRDGRRVRPVRASRPVVQPVVVPNTNTAPAIINVPAAQPVQQTRMALVPSADVAQKYVHRNISGQSDFAVYDFALANKKNVLIYGPTGPGKTTSAIAYAAERRIPVFMVSGTVSLEASQLFGRYIPDGQGGFVWQDGGVTEVARHGGVLILDEVNFIPSKISTVLFSLLASTTRSITLLDHKGETIVAHPDLLVVATMNPHGQYAGTQEMNAAFRNRFSIQLNWGYDDNVEKVLVKHKSLRELAKQLRAAEAKEDINTPTPTNALIDFTELAEGLGLDFAISNFVARYEEEEQASVKLVIDAHRANIEADFSGVALPTVENDESTDSIQTLADISLDL